MPRKPFPLSSDQLELLKEFENAGSLEALADKMAKDPSVVSRRLQILSQAFPVLIKESGRWKITYLGRKINELSHRFLADLTDLIKSQSKVSFKEQILPPKTVLVIINAQKALHYSSYGRRNNLKAEEKILQLLKLWRKRSWPIVHIKHISSHKESLFHTNAETCQFMSGFEPIESEMIFEKNKSSAFSNSQFRNFSKKQSALILTGFTGADCIDATARDAKKLGLFNFVVSDATVTFDLKGANGKIVKADKVHQAVLANIHHHFSIVIESESVF